MLRVRHKTDLQDSPRGDTRQKQHPEPGQPANGESPTTEAALDVWLELLIDFIVNAVVEEHMRPKGCNGESSEPATN